MRKRSIVIRAATPDDLAQLRQLHRDNWRTDYAGQLGPAFLDQRLDIYMEALWTALPAAPDRVIVADQDGHVVGFGVIRPGRAQGAYLDNLHVDRGLRGQGVGRTLMAEVARVARDSGDTALYLTVMRGNASARSFYRELGGIEGPCFEDDFDGEAVPAHHISWSDLQRLEHTAASGADAKKNSAGHRFRH